MYEESTEYVVEEDAIPVDEPTPVEEETDGGVVGSDDDIDEIFSRGYESVEGTSAPTPTQRLIAHNHGYFIKTTESGWLAVRRS